MSTVGLPAKSGVAGLVYVVVPHVMGLAVFSPPLDSHGNSVRGVEFCKRLLQVYPFGIFDQIVRGARFASIGGGSAASSSAGAGAGSATPGVGSPALMAAGAGDRKSKKMSAIEAVTDVEEATTTTASVYGAGGASGKLRDEGAGGSVMSMSTGHIGGGSGAISRANRNGRRPSVQASKDAMAAVAGGRETTQSYHSGAARLDAWNRVFRSLVRLHSALRRLRVWCGLPVSAGDLERLLYAAAADGDTDSFPEFAGLIAASGDAVAAASQGPMWEGDAAVQYELYREYRSTFGPTSHEAFSVEDSIGAATVAAAAAAVSGGSGLGSVADDDLAVGLAADLQPCTFKVPASALRRYVELQGISTGSDNPHMHGLWKQLQQRHAVRSSRSSMVVSSPAAKSGIGAAAAAAIVSAVQTFTLADLFVPMSAAESRSNTIIRTLLGGLSMPHFRGFVEDMMSIYESVKRKVKDGAVYDQLDIEELSSADPEAFGVAICTVDGQMLNIGDTDIEFPLMGAVRPLIYALACADNGVAEVERWVGVEPTAAAAETFSLMPAGGGGHGGPAHEPVKAAPMPADGYFHPEPERAPHPRPFNPFLDSGALAISALMGRAHYPSEQRLFHDNGSRFSHMLNQFRKWCGGRRVGFNNSVFLAQKQKRLKTVAISFYAKGACALPRGWACWSGVRAWLL
jgi:glutaminase